MNVDPNNLIPFVNLVNECCGVMDDDYVGTWLTTPNSNFNMDKPINLFSDGDTDKLYRILYFIEIGEADLI